MGANTTEEKVYSQLPDFIKALIDKEVKRATEEELENAKKRIDERKAQIVAGVMLYVQKQMNVETLQNSVVITIKTN